MISDFFNNLDATTYFLVNSGVVIGATAVIFSIFGIMFGAFTWGRYKQHWLKGASVIESLKGENALLKRRIAEHATRPLPTPGGQSAKPQYMPIIMPPTVTTATLPKLNPVPALMPRSASFTVWTETNWRPQPVVANTPRSAALAIKIEPAVNTISSHPARSFTIWTEVNVPESIPSDVIVNEPPLDTLSSVNLNGNSRASESGVLAHPFRSELESGRVRHDLLMGIIFVEPPKKGDDLTKIKGINSTCRNSLQAQGIYTYKQIAQWTPVQIGEFARRLSLDARIQTDRWVEQARELHAKKHGERF